MCQFESEKQAYILYSKLNTHKKRVAEAISICKEALSCSKNPAMSFSSGKDSIVMLDIAVKAGFHGDLIFFKYGIVTDIETPAENIELLKHYACKHGLQYHILDCLGEVDCWEQCGRFTLFPDTDEEKRIFASTNKDFSKKSEQFCKGNCIDMNFIGMQKAESKRRQVVLQNKGSIYETKSRTSKTCCPLANFTLQDIWAYIFSNNLPYLSIYDYSHIDRCRNRNEITLLYNDSLVRNGAIFHFKNMYPEFFAWVKERWGDVI